MNVSVVGDVFKAAGLSARQFRRLCRSGVVKAEKKGGVWLIPFSGFSDVSQRPRRGARDRLHRMLGRPSPPAR